MIIPILIGLISGVIGGFLGLGGAFIILLLLNAIINFVQIVFLSIFKIITAINVLYVEKNLLIKNKSKEEI